MKIGTFVRISSPCEAEGKFKKLAEQGFSACQLVYRPEEYTEAAALEIKEAAEKHNIDISAQFCGFYDNDVVWDNYYGYYTAGINNPIYRKSRIDYIRSATDFAHSMGVEDIVVHIGFVAMNPFSEEYLSMVMAVWQVAKHCESIGMNLLIETGTEAPIVLLRLIEDVGLGNVYINFDPANILMYGYGNPVDALRVYGRYVRNIHGKDGMLPTSSKALGKETPVGKGMVDFPEVFRLLKALSYDRYIIIEREIEGEKQLEDILVAKAYFEKLW